MVKEMSVSINSGFKYEQTLSKDKLVLISIKVVDSRFILRLANREFWITNI